MKPLLALCSLIPAWGIAIMVAWRALSDPHIWGLSIFVPALCGLYSIITVWLLDS